MDYVKNIHRPVCKVKVGVDASSCTESCSGCHESFAVSIALPSSDSQGESDDDAVDSNDDDKVSCSPSWASLDSHNLAAQSMSPKLKFDGNALHDDRVRVHQGINRSIQLCVTDSQGRLMAIPSEDVIEICLPGIAL